MNTIDKTKNPKQPVPGDFTGKVIYYNGTVRYFKNGLQNRDNGLPAVEYNGYKSYFIEGKRHRIGGAAILWPDGRKEYWINDKLVSKEAHDLLVNLMKLKGTKI